MSTTVNKCKCGVEPEVVREDGGRKRIVIFCKICKGAVNCGPDEATVIREWNEGMAKQG